jgi:hypothetical protein
LFLQRLLLHWLLLLWPLLQRRRQRWLIIIYKYTLQTHKKSLRIQQQPASAFTAEIKKSTRTGQAHASKTSQANTTEHYSTHSSVGTRMPARKLAPLHLANMPTDAR